jgi:hypothetical protein
VALNVDVVYFQKRIALLIEGLAARFDELECRDFPNKSPEGVISLFKRILVLISQKIVSADDKELPLLFGLLCHYQSLLTFLDNSHTEQTPRGLILIIEELIGRFNPIAQFIASPQAKYNYSIFDLKPNIINPLKNVLTPEEIDSLPDISKAPIHIIMFPRAERDNVLVHAVFGHEVGHLYASKYLEEEANKPDFLLEMQNKVSAVLVLTPVDPALSPMEQLKIKGEIHNNLMWLRRRAMEELLSDYVGVIMFGPSALFAAYELFSLSDLDSLPVGREAYPPSRYRLRFVLNVLKEEGFLDSFASLVDKSLDEKKKYLFEAKRLLEEIEKITNLDSDLTVLKGNPHIDVAYQWVDESLSAAKAIIKSTIPSDLVYSSKDFFEEIPELIERLTLNVPPNELGIYPDIKLPCWQSALASSWIYKINGNHFDVSGGVQPYSLGDFHTINKLCLRAVESIALHRDYLKHIV